MFHGYGTPFDGFVLIWKNSAVSQKKLGYAATVSHLENVLKKCSFLNRGPVKAAIKLAKQAKGQTMYDELVEIMSKNPNVDIRLE